MKAVCLLLVFVLAKALVLAGRDLPRSAWAPAAYLWQDVLVVLAFAAFDLTFRRRPWVGWAAYTLIVVYTAVNVPVGRVLATPLTWPMLRAARGTLADSIAYHATAGNLLCAAAVLAAGAALPRALRRLRGRVPRRYGVLAMLGAALLLALGPLAARRVPTLGLHRNVLAALVTTALPRVAAVDLAGDWRLSPFGNPRGEDLSRLRGAAAGRNVVVVHLESTAARRLRPYGYEHDPMPNLTALAGRAVLFENAYTTYPETVKSFFATQCAVHPALDVAPEAYERVRAPGLAAVLAGRGYRTGLFHSGRFGYVGMDAVLRGRGYDTLEDAGAIGGERESSFGIDEPSAVRRALGWIDSLPKGQRFLVSYLPIAGHHPYATPEPGPFPEGAEEGRYLNALRYADQALGQLLRGLRERGLERDTLVVVCGDHGQAFGEHPGNFGHTLFVYEENVRVPLLFAAAGVTDEPARVGRVASLVDLAPTVLDLLGVEAPEGQEGRSLLAGEARLALFCTDYSLGLVGLRDGPWKLIHELDSGTSRLYRLDDDPGETNDLSAAHPERAAAYADHLRRWASAQKYRIVKGD